MNILNLLPEEPLMSEGEIITFCNNAYDELRLGDASIVKLYWANQIFSSYGYCENSIENFNIKDCLLKVYKLAQLNDAKANLCLGHFLLGFYNKYYDAKSEFNPIPFLKKAYFTYKKEATFYIGISLMNIGEFDLALRIFNKAIIQDF